MAGPKYISVDNRERKGKGHLAFLEKRYRPWVKPPLESVKGNPHVARWGKIDREWADESSGFVPRQNTEMSFESQIKCARSAIVLNAYFYVRIASQRHAFQQDVISDEEIHSNGLYKCSLCIQGISGHADACLSSVGAFCCSISRLLCNLNGFFRCSSLPLQERRLTTSGFGAGPGSISAHNRSVSRFLVLLQGIPHVSSLLLHGKSLLMHSLPLEVAQQGDGNSGKRRYDSAGDKPPFGRRFVFAFSSEIALIPACYFGSRFRARGRNGLGTTLIAASFGVFSAALALIVMTGFSWSWGWWL